MNIELLSHKHNLDTLERKLLQYLYDNIDEIKSIGIRKLHQITIPQHLWYIN